MRVAFTTLGCKINQFETDAMQKAAAAEGNSIVPFDAEADVYVINTCSVTAKSDYQCRQAIRAAIRRGEGAQVIVTGCYAETQPNDVRSIPGVSLVLGNKEKTSITRYLAGSKAPNQGPALIRRDLVKRRTREFIKIQDGCDNRCTYCIVPIARGGSQSVPGEQVIALFDKAIAGGCPEIVLSGIHIGRYGQDLAIPSTLTDLVRHLLTRREQARVRVSSIEPNEITDELVGMLGSGLCRHLHIPLQSGDDSILSSMNRTYTSRFYRELVRSVADRVPDIALGADVMVGFPGEGEKEFRNTFELVNDLPLTHLHVFSYSPRPGTPAANLAGQVADQIKKERSELLRELGRKKNIAFRKGLLGKTLSVVLEDRQMPGEWGCSGLTDNYVRVEVPGVKKGEKQKEINIHVDDINETGLSGSIVVTS